MEIRKVRASNLVAEMGLIQRYLQSFPILSMDTEFPGTIYQPINTPKNLLSTLSPDKAYAMMKCNVNDLNIIQLGLTLCDIAGNHPDHEGCRIGALEFNFSDFDYKCDRHDPRAISLLKNAGIDFSLNRILGVDSKQFASQFMMLDIGLCDTWVMFHCPYDLGFMIKSLTRQPLPDSLVDFMALVRVHLCPNVYDLKPVAEACGLHGGLDKIGKSLMLERALGSNHQAGSDSLFTMQIYVQLVKRYGEKNEFNYVFYGLTKT